MTATRATVEFLISRIIRFFPGYFSLPSLFRRRPRNFRR